MAGGWHVRLERDVPGVETSSDSGLMLLYLQRQIDELAERHRLRKLSAFFSADPAAVSAYLAEQGLDPSQYDLPDEEWHEATEGLETVRGLLDAIRAKPDAVPKGERVLAELEAVEQALAAAAVQDVRFHLARRLTPPEESR